MTQHITFTAIAGSDHPLLPELKAIYQEAFEEDERVNFEELSNSAGRHEAGVDYGLVALMLADQPAGLAAWAYETDLNIGYIRYVAVRAGQRGQGLGGRLWQNVMSQIEAQALRAQGSRPRLVVWEIRDAADAPSEEERQHRLRRQRFYERLQGQATFAYICPPVRAGQPELRLLLMAQTFPPSRRMSRAEAWDMAWTGLRLNGAEMEDSYAEYARKALEEWDYDAS